MKKTTLQEAIRINRMNRKIGRIEALAKAGDYEPEDSVIRHQCGVALSKMGKVS